MSGAHSRRRRRRFGALGAVLSGLSWNSAGQLASLAISVGLTPFLLLRLGLERYGLFSLVTSFIGLLSNLDGGLGASALRYFSVNVGKGDRRATSRLLMTAASVLLSGGAVLGSAAFLVAPVLAAHLHAARQLRPLAVLLLRVLVPLLVVSMLRELVQGLLAANHRWRLVNVVGVSGRFCYSAVAFALVAGGLGVMGLVWATAASEAVMGAASLVAARRYVAIGSLRPLGLRETGSFLRYAGTIQVAAIASLFNFEIDALVVGAFLPLRFVAVYSVGANFALQLRSLPLNALGPIQVTLSHTFGRGGLEPALEEHRILQRLWTRAVTALPLVGAASAWFAISCWLGPRLRLAGLVATVLLSGYAVNLLTGPLSALVYSVSRPDIERDYGVLSAAVNVVLTISLVAALGLLGVVLATALSQAVGSLWFLRASRRRISAQLQSCFSGIPWLAVAGSAACAVALEVPVYRLDVRGPAGLLLCALAAVPALACYAVIAEPRLAWSSLTLVRDRDGRASLASAARHADWPAVGSLVRIAAGEQQQRSSEQSSSAFADVAWPPPQPAALTVPSHEEELR